MQAEKMDFINGGIKGKGYGGMFDNTWSVFLAMDEGKECLWNS